MGVVRVEVMGRWAGRAEASQAPSLTVSPAWGRWGSCSRAGGNVTGGKGATFPVWAAYL